jgi:TM2 domain-containing membrane protein YozV
MDDGQEFCAGCGSRAGSAATGQRPVIYVRDKSAGIAAILSFLVLGLGQIYVGKIVRGLVLMFAYALSIILIMVLMFATIWDGSVFYYDDVIGALVLLFIVSIIYLIVWIWNVFDAYKLANEYNDRLMADGKRPW